MFNLRLQTWLYTIYSSNVKMASYSSPILSQYSNSIHAHLCVYTCTSYIIVPFSVFATALVFLWFFLQQLPLVFQLWTSLEPWTLLSSFCTGSRIECIQTMLVGKSMTFNPPIPKLRRSTASERQIYLHDGLIKKTNTLFRH